MDDYLEPSKGSLGNVNSEISKYKVDCGEGKLTWLNVTYYSQSMGRGKITAEHSPNRTSYPNPKYVTDMKFVCNY